MGSASEIQYRLHVDGSDPRVPVTRQTPFPVAVSYGEGQPIVDAFGRLRVSNPVTIFDGRAVRTKNPIVWTEAITGAGTSTLRTNEASVRIATAGSGDKVVRQSRWNIPYQPGKSDLLFQTFAPNGQQTNARKRAGRFNDNNGCFLEWTDTAINFVVRSKATGSVVDTKVEQANWNLDRLDGTGPSRKVLDLNDTQILVVDFEWLGVGRVRFGFVIDGLIFYCHEALHANNGLSTVYMSTATLPIRYEVEQLGAGTAFMDCICASLIREGGEVDPGVPRGRVTASTKSVSPGSPQSLMRLRLDSLDVEGFAKVTGVDAITTTDRGQFKWWLVLNPTFTGGTPASFVDETDSILEYDVTGTGVWNNDGYVVTSGLATTAGGGISLQEDPRANAYALGVGADGAADVLALIVDPLGAGALAFHGCMNWIETP